MLKVERQAKILQLLRERTYISNEELSKVLNVSIVTVRRDLKELNKQKLIKIEHGGPVLLDYINAGIEPYYETKYFLKHEQKIAIAKKACTLIEDNDIIALDTGTTNNHIASQLKLLEIKNLTVFTNDLIIAKELSCNINYKIVFVGGTIKPNQYNAYGMFTDLILSHIKARKLFLGSDGADISWGISNFSIEEVSVKKKMIEISNEVILVADSSKFGIQAPYHVAEWGEINRIITDDKIEEKFVDFLESENKSVFKVSYRETD